MQTPPREESECPSPATRGPAVIVQGLTFQDLRRAILLGFALYGVFQFAAQLTTLLLFFLLVFILAAVMNPAVNWLQARRVPRIAGALLLAAGVLGFLVLIGFLALPPLLAEIRKFAGNLDEKQSRLTAYYTQLTHQMPWLAGQIPPPDELARNLAPRLTSLVGQVGRYTMNVAVGVLSLLLMLVLVIFTVAHPDPLITGLLGAAPERNRHRVETALRRILQQLKNWAFGSLILGVIIGVMTAIGLWTLGKLTGHPVPYILMFSLLAGLGELVPNIGPILSAVPPALVALTVDPILAVWVIVLFIIIQQAENNLIVPLVMGQSLNLHPVSVTFTVLVMGALFGLLGAILAVPTCAIAKVCWEEFYLKPRHTDTEALQVIAGDIVANSTSEEPRDQNLAEREDKSLAAASEEDHGPASTSSTEQADAEELAPERAPGEKTASGRKRAAR